MTETVAPTAEEVVRKDRLRTIATECAKKVFLPIFEGCSWESTSLQRLQGALTSTRETAESELTPEGIQDRGLGDLASRSRNEPYRVCVESIRLAAMREIENYSAFFQNPSGFLPLKHPYHFPTETLDADDIEKLGNVYIKMRKRIDAIAQRIVTETIEAMHPPEEEGLRLRRPPLTEAQEAVKKSLEDMLIRAKTPRTEKDIFEDFVAHLYFKLPGFKKPLVIRQDNFNTPVLPRTASNFSVETNASREQIVRVLDHVQNISRLSFAGLNPNHRSKNLLKLSQYSIESNPEAQRKLIILPYILKYGQLETLNVHLDFAGENAISCLMNMRICN